MRPRQSPWDVVRHEIGRRAAKTSFLTTLSLATDLYDRPSMDGAEIERVDVHRLDNWDSTSIVIEVDAVIRRGVAGSASERRSSIQEVYDEHVPELESIAADVLAQAQNELDATANAGGARPCVFNPLAMPRREVIDGALIELPPLAGVAIESLSPIETPAVSASAPEES